MRYGDIHDTYEDARLKAKTDFWKHYLKDDYGYAPSFEEVTHGYSYTLEPRIAYRGFISTCLIDGTNRERTRDFSRNMLPLRKPNEGDFKNKWMKVKGNIPSWLEGGNPILVKEFLHQYYVLEGNKRTSVAKYLDMPGLDARVIRAIPDKNQVYKEVQLYHEFLDYEKRTGVNYLWFSEEGKFDELEEIISWYAPQNMNRYAFLNQYLYKPFHDEYQLCKMSPAATEGDIFLDYLKEIPDLMIDNNERRETVQEVVKKHKKKNRMRAFLESFRDNDLTA